MRMDGYRRGRRRTRRVAQPLVAALAAAAAGLVWTAPAWAGTAVLRGVGSGRCLDVSGAGTANGSALELWDCTGGAGQQWSYDTATKRVVVYGNKCLDASGHGTADGTLSRAATATAAQTEAYNRITAAMDQAVAVYNCYTGFTKAVNVQYDPSVPTADANLDGTLRFGATSTMQQVTAMHELAHTVGVGTSGAWAGLVSGGRWTGASAIAQLRSLTGDPAAVVGADGQHFWPYGLNYTSEVTSAQDLVRHCLMVVALRRDLGR